MFLNENPMSHYHERDKHVQYQIVLNFDSDCIVPSSHLEILDSLISLSNSWQQPFYPLQYIYDKQPQNGHLDKWIKNDLYEKYKEQTDLRVGVAIGYLIFLLIPIWLEWSDDSQKNEYELNCIWYWHVAFFSSIPILLFTRGWEMYCKHKLNKF